MPGTSLTGFRIHHSTPRPGEALLAAFRGIPTGQVCDAMDRLGALDWRIKPLSPESALCGPALTVRTRPGDNLMVWKAVDVAQPGDVLVIATYGHTVTSTFGEFVVKAAKAKGVAGIVCDGMCRDLSGIRATGLPTFVLGASPAAPGKDGPGEIGGRVSCGGVVVEAGDIVVGDEDGVVVVPLADGGAVALALDAVRQKEASMQANLDAGQLIPGWVDKRLAELGCELRPKKE
jgi:regulator of RNase E activity RraA